MNFLQKILGRVAPEKKSTVDFALLQELPSFSRDYSNMNFALEGYIENPIIYKCIRLIADLGSDLELDPYRGDTLLPQSAFLNKLKRPNSLQDKNAFLNEVIVNDRIHGNTYILVTVLDDRVTSLKCLSPQSVRLTTMIGKKYPAKYEYFVSENESIVFPVDQITGLAKNGSNLLLHLKTYNPLSQYMGLSPIYPCAIAGDLFNYGLRWNISLLKNSAKPSGILKTSTTLLDEQFVRLKEQVASFFQGGANAGGVPILENGLEFQSMSLSPEDMDFTNTIKLSQKIIANTYNVPLALICDENSTYNNVAEAKKALYYDAVLPLMNRIINFLNMNLSKYFGGEELRINQDSIQVLSVDRGSMFERMTRAYQAGLLTREEARAELGY